MKNLKDSIKVDHNYDKDKSFLYFDRQKKNQDKMPVIINADAKTNHQSVVNVMEASRRAGLTKITFSTKVN